MKCLIRRCNYKFSHFCFNNSISRCQTIKYEYISIFNFLSHSLLLQVVIPTAGSIMLQEILFWILFRIRRVWYKNLLRLGDCYEVDCSERYLLGRGTYGTVWRGRNVRTREEVAIKEVRKSTETQKFIKRELELMEKCNHRNIIRLQWSCEDTFCRYFVMDYCPNSNLNAFMVNRKISLWLCLRFMRNFAEAVLYLHQKKISHRDIKPLNILVKQNGGYYLLLADFGLARYFPSSSTGIYASPDTGNFVTSVQLFGIICFHLQGY